MFKMKFPTKRIFRIFHILRINGMAPFCNLFMERPSYLHNYLNLLTTSRCKQCKWHLNYTLTQKHMYVSTSVCFSFFTHLSWNTQTNH